MVKKLKTGGFTLLEVLMAMTIFSFFILAFSMSQGFNITSSATMAEDIKMHNLGERVINEAILNPPKFTDATPNSNVSKAFEEEGYTNYKYTIAYSKLEVPDFATLIGKTEKEAEEEASNGKGAIQKMVYGKLKTNIEKIIWQLTVTITNTDNDYNYELSTWVTNLEAKVDSEFSF